jgi:DNA polymerase-1
MKLNPQKTVFLIDGSSFLYRAYYGLRPLHTPQGQPVQAVYSFCRMIKKLIDTFSPEHIALVWDSKGKTTRHEMYQDYKATRLAPPSDLFDQKKLIMDFADAILLPQNSRPGIEADDIMYSVAQEQKKNGYTCVLVTSDKDMGQALDELVVMYDFFKDEFTDVATFEQKRGFPVSKLPFYFAILGDTSDNIPGVKGIGEKGAADLVKQFASLDDMYAHLELVSKERTRTLLKEQKDNAILSLQLFTLQYHPTGLSINDLSFKSTNWSQAGRLFEAWNFKSLLKDIETFKGESPQESLQAAIKELDKYTLKVVTTTTELEQVCREMVEHKRCAIDTETTGLSALQDELVGISLCMEEGRAYYVPFGHKTGEVQLSKEQVFSALKPLLEDASYAKYLHNAKFDYLVLYHAGINLQGIVFDTALAASVLSKGGRVGLKALSMEHFNEQMLNFDEIVKAYKIKDFSYAPLSVAGIYSALDAHQTFRLQKIFAAQLQQENLDQVYYAIEHPTMHILCGMELEGIPVDAQVLKDIDVHVTKGLQYVEQEILSIIGPENKNINLNSPKQLEDLLFTQLQLPPQKKSAKGTSYSTDQEVLEILATMHAVPALIIKHRELSKLKNTYIDALPGYINPQTGCIHTTFNQVLVATGRLASSDPNLQNIPVNSVGIRGAFKPKSGCIFLSADYSQIELRVLAQLSGDAQLREAFLAGQDIHAQTAARLFDVTIEHVTHQQRQVGKRINFSILYGLTPYGLSQDLKIPFGQAKKYIEKYFEQYPGVLVWMEQVVEETKQRGYVTTLWGRRRYVPGIYEKNRVLYDEARRVAINTVAQGTAAEVMKKGMIALNDAFKRQGLGARMILQIHDELLISVPCAEQAVTQNLVKNVLEQVVSWDIPLVVTTRFGADWGEVTK